MSSASFTPAPVRTARHHGASAAAGPRHHHPLGSALRAAKAFAGAAIGVVLLGESEYGEAGVRRR
ncbi:hypothetical protein [Streptomyces sp. YIM 130001]|uniref:hypothetical protein n=1 Tax=Streptomyces sp. YIM 130001 TaxID=2259644 RepID=UPI000E657F7E|nr:hypothetical protein [Streptomyces sp. YIM 130001]